MFEQGGGRGAPAGAAAEAGLTAKAGGGVPLALTGAEAKAGLTAKADPSRVRRRRPRRMRASTDVADLGPRLRRAVPARRSATIVRTFYAWETLEPKRQRPSWSLQSRQTTAE